MQPEITNTEAIQLMERCKHEIMDLRAQIARLTPKADAYDNLVIVLGLLPKPSQPYGEDLVGMLNKRIQELTPKPVNEAAAHKPDPQ